MRKVTGGFWISPQPSASDLGEAARSGIAMVINNRPDGEEDGQPSAAETFETATRHGMDYVHLPIPHGQFTLGRVRAFQGALAASEGPVLAHCKSGTRSLTLWTIGEVLDGRLELDAVGAVEERTGVDLSGARKWLAGRA